MRTATPETVRALRQAVKAAGSIRAWAAVHDIRPVDVSDAVNGKAMSARRENRLRPALGLEPLRWQQVELLEGQRVVTSGKPRSSKRRASTMTAEEAERADAMARAAGHRSWGSFAVARLLREGHVD